MNNYDIEKQKTLIVKIYHENSQSLLFLKKNLHIIMLLVFFFNLYYLYMCLWSFPDFSVNLYTLFYNLIYLWTAWSLVNYWI